MRCCSIPNQTCTPSSWSLAERLTLNRTGSALAMSSRFDLAARVSAVLDAHQRREPAGPRWKMSVTAVALLLLAVVAPLRAVAVHLVESTPTLAGAPRNSNIGTPRVAVGRWHDAAEPLFAPPSPSKVNGAPIVTFSLTSPDPAERAAAAWQLGIPGDRSAVPQLVALLDDGAPLPPQIFCGTHPPFEDESWAPRYEEVFEPSPGEAATRALLAVGDAAIEALTDTLLRASHWRARKNAAWALAHRGHAAAALINALNDPAWQVRAEAAYALFQRGSKEGDVVDALLAASEDGAWPVREQAVLAVGAHALHYPRAA